MLLSHKTSIKVSQDYANIIGHMCYAAYKLWNICNYERYHYKELGIENPRPPRFKQEGISIVYMQNAVVHEKENGRVRLSLPKQLKIYMEERYGIRLVKQEESYTSQCSPLSREVSRSCAEPSNRRKRGLYCDETGKYNADALGAFNIMRKYLCVIKERCP